MPHLPDFFYYVCIDLPSHGKSSYLPGHLPIHSQDYVIAYKMILDYLEQKKCIIIGHSYGGQIGFFFSQIYPDYVLKIILLDTIYFLPYPERSYLPYLRGSFEDYIKALSNHLSPETKPSYTYEEALNKLIYSRRYGKLTRESGEPILKRCIEQLPNGKYAFTLDPRLKCIQNPGFTMRTSAEMILRQPLKCPHLFILAKETAWWDYIRPVMDAVKKNKKARIQFVDGDHDVHNKHPERVAMHINKFLLGNKL